MNPTKQEQQTEERRNSGAEGERGGGDKPKGTAAPVQFPSLALPKGGGAIQGYFFLLFITVFLSCNSDSLSPADYLKWMAEHRTQLSASQQQGDIAATLVYLAADWLSINEASAQHPEQIAAIQKEYVGLVYYRLRLAASLN